MVDLVALLTRRDVTCGFSGKVWTVHESLKQKELPAHYFTVTRHPGEHVSIKQRMSADDFSSEEIQVCGWKSA